LAITSAPDNPDPTPHPQHFTEPCFLTNVSMARCRPFRRLCAILVKDWQQDLNCFSEWRIAGH
jgi:hypothetical protein